MSHPDRNSASLEALFAAIRSQLQAHPDLRVGQLLIIAAQLKQHDLFYMENTELANTLYGYPASRCECGCGGETTRTVRLLREQDRGTAQALHWNEQGIGPMRVQVLVIGGHEKDLNDYVVFEGDEKK